MPARLVPTETHVAEGVVRTESNKIVKALAWLAAGLAITEMRKS
jgi:hypothetical protein